MSERCTSKCRTASRYVALAGCVVAVSCIGEWVNLASGLAFLRPLQVSNRRLATPRYAERRPESIDVRSLLQQAGLILPEPTETLVSEEESLEVETPIGLLQQGISQRLNRTIEEIEENLIRPNRETVVAEDEEIEIETPLSKLDAPLQWLKRNFDISPQREKFISEKKAVKIETPLSALFPGISDEAFESTESWTDLLLPLLDADSAARSIFLMEALRRPHKRRPFGILGSLRRVLGRLNYGSAI